MKKFILLLILFLPVLVVCSCSSDDDAEPTSYITKSQLYGTWLDDEHEGYYIKFGKPNSVEWKHYLHLQELETGRFEVQQNDLANQQHFLLIDIYVEKPHDGWSQYLFEWLNPQKTRFRLGNEAYTKK